MRMKSRIDMKSHQQKIIEDDEPEIPDDLELSSKSNDESIKFNIIPDIPLKPDLTPKRPTSNFEIQVESTDINKRSRVQSRETSEVSPK